MHHHSQKLFNHEADLVACYADCPPASFPIKPAWWAPDQARKDPTQRSLEARLRNARYLAELAKFRVASFGTVFSALKTLLDDFAGHNVDAAAALVEAAGRFLYRLPETHMRMANMLDVRSLPATIKPTPAWHEADAWCHCWGSGHCTPALGLPGRPILVAPSRPATKHAAVAGCCCA